MQEWRDCSAADESSCLMCTCMAVLECACTSINSAGCAIDDRPNNVQLDLRGHRTQVAYTLYYSVYPVGPELCRNTSHRYPYNFELCMQLLCNALPSLVARYLAYHL